MASSRTISPLHDGFRMIVDRLKWIARGKPLHSKLRLRRLRLSQKGQNCLILCNGPSLLHSDFEAISRSKIFTFGLNKINLLKEFVNYSPSCVVAVNRHVIEQNTDFYNAASIPLFIGRDGLRHISFRDNVVFLHNVNSLKVASDCSASISTGGTVTAVAIQLAFHYGFSKIGLIGCDHNFETKGRANALHGGLEKDRNHFHPGYFGKTNMWELPDLARSEMYYQLLLEEGERIGSRIFNCTEGGKLEVFPRLKLSEFLDGRDIK